MSRTGLATEGKVGKTTAIGFSQFGSPQGSSCLPLRFSEHRTPLLTWKSLEESACIGMLYLDPPAF